MFNVVAHGRSVFHRACFSCSPRTFASDLQSLGWKREAHSFDGPAIERILTLISDMQDSSTRGQGINHIQFRLSFEHNEFVPRCAPHTPTPPTPTHLRVVSFVGEFGGYRPLVATLMHLLDPLGPSWRLGRRTKRRVFTSDGPLDSVHIDGCVVATMLVSCFWWFSLFLIYWARFVFPRWDKLKIYGFAFHGTAACWIWNRGPLLMLRCHVCHIQAGSTGLVTRFCISIVCRVTSRRGSFYSRISPCWKH